MPLTELELLREVYRQLKKIGFQQRKPEERERLEGLFKKLAGLLGDGARERESAGAREKEEPGRGGAEESPKKAAQGRGKAPKEGLSRDHALPRSRARSEMAPVLAFTKGEEKEGTLYLNVDGASKGNPGPAGAGGLVTAGDGAVLARFALPLGVRTNNEAEYLALIEGLKMAREMAPKKLVVRSDSLLLVKQVRGEFKIKKNALLKLNLEARRHFPKGEIIFQYVPREQNAEADALANEGAAKNE